MNGNFQLKLCCWGGGGSFLPLMLCIFPRWELADSGLNANLFDQGPGSIIDGVCHYFTIGARGYMWHAKSSTSIYTCCISWIMKPDATLPWLRSFWLIQSIAAVNMMKIDSQIPKEKLKKKISMRLPLWPGLQVCSRSLSKLKSPGVCLIMIWFDIELPHEIF